MKLSEQSLSLLERYELKYTIPFDMIEPICRFVEPYCDYDNYSKKSPDGYYQINNLYLDTPAYSLIKLRKEGAENRFNMRVRAYGEHPGFPVFFEVKQKTGGIIRKFRSQIHDPDWHKAFIEPGYTIPDNGKDEKNTMNRQLFERLVATWGLEPKIVTNYRRKALFSTVDHYGRVTFDVNLRFMQAKGWSVIPDPQKMAPYDNPFNYDPGTSVILELKCPASHVPLWMVDVIQTFGLVRRSFSKYMNGVREMYGYLDPVKNDRSPAYIHIPEDWNA